jgi:cell division inhibitor SulA
MESFIKANLSWGFTKCWVTCFAQLSPKWLQKSNEIETGVLILQMKTDFREVKCLAQTLIAGLSTAT